mmetsp:Transcript_38363/g.112310  ORF Transcript_38363/g.112310 Transcript_38363/m.112310 type:complete len:204 (+) Transcript_38363:441-1052(+)
MRPRTRWASTSLSSARWASAPSTKRRTSRSSPWPFASRRTRCRARRRSRPTSRRCCRLASRRTATTRCCRTWPSQKGSTCRRCTPSSRPCFCSWRRTCARAAQRSTRPARRWSHTSTAPCAAHVAGPCIRRPCGSRRASKRTTSASATARLCSCRRASTTSTHFSPAQTPPSAATSASLRAARPTARPPRSTRQRCGASPRAA